MWNMLAIVWLASMPAPQGEVQYDNFAFDGMTIIGVSHTPPAKERGRRHRGWYLFYGPAMCFERLFRVTLLPRTPVAAIFGFPEPFRVPVATVSRKSVLELFLLTMLIVVVKIILIMLASMGILKMSGSTHR